ncbi:MAG: hypothetical protein FJW96_09855 [Actinobacteria bacterium]|nr:hypothetical protein [Actinomycetota bacterium]
MVTLLMRPWVATCSETGAALSDLYEDVLPARRERRLRRHLARCPGCQAVYASFVRAVEGLRSLGQEPTDASPTIVETVIAAIRSDSGDDPRRRDRPD